MPTQSLLRFGQGFEVEVQARFLSWSLVNILPLMFCRGYMKSNLGRDSEARFGQYFECLVNLSRDADVWSIVRS